MTNFKKLILLTFCITLYCCAFFTSYGRDYKRAQIEYNNHNYDEAIEYCIKSLKKKPGYEKSLEMYEKIIPLAINNHHERINKYTDESENKDNLVKEYKSFFKLIALIEEASISKSYLLHIKSDYTLEYNIALEKAAESHYNTGIDLMSHKDKRKYKKAVNEFNLSNKYINNYKNSNDYIIECKENAIFSITIMNFENNTNKDYNNIGNTISNKLISELLNNSSFTEFVDIVDREQINTIIEQLKLSSSGLVNDENQVQIGNIKGIDHIITGDINQIIINKPKHTSNRLQIEHLIQIGENIIINEDSTQTIEPIYETGLAHIKEHRIEAAASIEVFMKIINVETSEIINSQTFYSNIPYLDKWTTGLDQIDPIDVAIIALKLKNKTLRGFSPNTEELLQKAIKQTNNKMIKYIIEFYE